MRTELKRNLEGHEAIIESGMKSFVDVGHSLIAIRDEKLYDGKYDTFEAYCKKRWGLSRPRAYQIIASAEVVDDLSTMVDTQTQQTSGNVQIPLPENERQARAVADASDDAETRVKVWKAAVESAPKDENGNPKITAAVVKNAVEAVLGDTGDEPEKDTAPGTADEFGPVPEKLAPIFESVSEFKGLQKRIGAAQNDLEELQRSDAGAAIPIQELLNAFKIIKQGVKFAIPYCECPKCRRSKKNCDTCDGLRWITEATYKRCRTEDDEKWLKSKN